MIESEFADAYVVVDDILVVGESSFPTRACHEHPLVCTISTGWGIVSKRFLESK